MRKRSRNQGLLVLSLLTGLASVAFGTVIDFDSQGLTGPNVFAAAGPAQTINITTTTPNVTFTGGVILTATTGLSDTSSIYGTADFGTGLSNPLTITFASNISNFFVDVFNGEPFAVTYTVADNLGNSQTFSLPNISTLQTIGFAASGNVITIKAATTGSFDFEIDNIHFNEALPPNLSAPEPASWVLMGAGLAGLGLLGRRRILA